MKTRDQVLVSILWLALFAQWVTVVPIIVPDQITGILGPHSRGKEGVSGTVIRLGRTTSTMPAACCKTWHRDL